LNFLAFLFTDRFTAVKRVTVDSPNSP